MVAGLEKPTAGTIRIGERIVNQVSARDRDIAMVFQNYALYPHMTVYRNLAYPLRQQRMAKNVIRDRVQEVAEMLSLEGLMNRRPAQLSGGQRQRVAIGRALVREPAVSCSTSHSRTSTQGCACRCGQGSSDARPPRGDHHLRNP